MKSKSNKQIITAILVVAVLGAAVYCFAPRKQVSTDSGSRFIMGTVARVVAVADNGKKGNECIEAAFDQLRLVDELMSAHREDSELTKVNNQAYAAPVKVDEPLFEVLVRSVEISKLSGGAFDVTVGPLVDLFNQAGQSGIAPSAEQIATAKSKVGYEKMILNPDDRTVRFTVEGMKIDLGGIAKGYSIDKATEAILKCGASGGMVDVGGDIRCFGRPVDKDSWRIGLEDPSKADQGITAGGYLVVLAFNYVAVTTSGDYRRFVMLDGQKYSHIMDPAIGNSAKKLSSVTIIADNATDADALATAVTVMGLEKGIALVESLPHTEAILIRSSEPGRLIKTSGADKYIK